MKKFFLYFPFFIISTYCELIPNDRVITNPETTKDFNLVEGIIYNIVHLKSGAKLHGDNDGVYVSSAYSPYQFWSLRKANDNQYNIVNVETGTNLDGHDDDTYISSPEDNSRSNPFQHWIFTKINDDTYNIAHVNSESRNLDSNGREVYISNSNDNSGTNPYQKWTFKPSNYKLSAVVTDFTYPPDLKDKLDNYKTRISLLSGNVEIENPTNATLGQTIDKTETRSNSYTLEIRKSESFKVTKDIGVSFSISRNIFGLLGINTGFHRGIKREFNSTYEKVYKESVTEEVSYHIRQKIKVPPLTSIMVNSSVDKISIDVPFKAKIRITGKADRLDEYGNVVSMTDVEANALRYYLQKENYDEESIVMEGNSMIVSTSGTLKINGYGLDSKIEAIPLNMNPSFLLQEFSMLSILYHALFITFLFFIFFFAYQSYKFICKRRTAGPIHLGNGYIYNNYYEDPFFVK